MDRPSIDEVRLWSKMGILFSPYSVAILRLCGDIVGAGAAGRSPNPPFEWQESFPLHWPVEPAYGQPQSRLARHPQTGLGTEKGGTCFGEGLE